MRAQQHAGQADTFEPASQPQVNPALSAGLLDFHRAAATRNIEAICLSYLRLRNAAANMRFKDLLDMLSARLGQPASKLLVQAFARHECFMCTVGSATCANCDGSGWAEEGRKCPHCDGRGLSPCTFCRGTGWADWESIPPELLTAVQEARLAKLNTELQRLSDIWGKVNPEKFSRITLEQQRSVAACLTRMMSQAHELSARPGIADEQRASLGTVAGKIDNILSGLEFHKTEGASRVRTLREVTEKMDRPH